MNAIMRASSDSLCCACLMPDTGNTTCPHCGWQRGQSADSQHLQPGTGIHPPYRVARVLGHGGFGITYLGWDDNLQIKVAIKEYLPRDFARRDSDTGHIQALDEATADYFAEGLRQFLEEARILAKFQQHPGIVSVLNFFRAFGTGYMVMEYVDGETLKAYLAHGIGRLNWQQTLELFMQVMDALRAIHQAGLLHRDIAPDNIYLCNDGRIKLLDFGEARYGLSQQTGSLLVIKPGFAAEEQYRTNGVQGPWTDVYAVAACMYHCLTGRVPPEANARTGDDTLQAPSRCGVTLPSQAESALLRALSVRASLRPQSITEFQRSISAQENIPPSVSRSISTSPVTEVLLTSDIDNASFKHHRPGLAWRRWLWFLGVTVFLLSMLYRTLTTLSPRSVSLPPTSPVIDKPAISSGQNDEIDWSAQRMREREAAETLRQQQEAALKRFEEYHRQTAPATVRPHESETHELEHLQRLCDEWGAMMDCPKTPSTR